MRSPGDHTVCCYKSLHSRPPVAHGLGQLESLEPFSPRRSSGGNTERNFISHFCTFGLGTIPAFPRDLFRQGQLHEEVQCPADGSSSSLRASWPMFISASPLQAYTPWSEWGSLSCLCEGSPQQMIPTYRSRNLPLLSTTRDTSFPSFIAFAAIPSAVDLTSRTCV